MRPPGCRHTAIKYAPFYTLLSLSLPFPSFSRFFSPFFSSRFFSTVRYRAEGWRVLLLLLLAQMETEKGGRVDCSGDKAIKIEDEM